jgi:hypothetical protein
MVAGNVLDGGWQRARWWLAMCSMMAGNVLDDGRVLDGGRALDSVNALDGGNALVSGGRDGGRPHAR